MCPVLSLGGGRGLSRRCSFLMPASSEKSGEDESRRCLFCCCWFDAGGVEDNGWAQGERLADEVRDSTKLWRGMTDADRSGSRRLFVGEPEGEADAAETSGYDERAKKADEEPGRSRDMTSAGSVRRGEDGLGRLRSAGLPSTLFCPPATDCGAYEISSLSPIAAVLAAFVRR